MCVHKCDGVCLCAGRLCACVQFLLCSILLCLGFSLAQPAFFARIYTSFPFALTSPPAISCSPPPPPPHLCIRSSSSSCSSLSSFFYTFPPSFSLLFLQLRKNAAITFFHSILLSAANVHPQGRFDSQGCRGADKTGKRPSLPKLTNEMKWRIIKKGICFVWQIKAFDSLRSWWLLANAHT